MFFLLFCLFMERSGSVKTITDPDPGGRKIYGTDPTTLVKTKGLGPKKARTLLDNT